MTAREAVEAHASKCRAAIATGGPRPLYAGPSLIDADLRGADLSGAAGIVRRPVGDPRGYDVVAVAHEDGWRIAAGCRWYTVAEAREHWGAEYEGDRAIGDRYIAALDWLAAQPVPQVAA